MSDLAKLKNKKPNRLRKPPAIEEAGENLTAPEHAPAISDTDKTNKNPRPKRKTGRTEPFATRVSPEFLKKLKLLAVTDDLKMVEVLEKALEAYEETRN